MTDVKFLTLFLLCAAILTVLLAVFRKEIRVILSSKELILTLISFFIIVSFSMRILDQTILSNNQYIYFAITVSCIVTALFYGFITKLILQIICREDVSITEIIFSVNKWFIPSFLACCLGMLGSFLIFEIFSNLERHRRTFLVLVWAVFTFALYPLLISSKKNPFKALPEIFKITFQTIYKWFYLYLILALISGEILKLFPTRSTQVSWLGGYLFQSEWYNFFQESIDSSIQAKLIIYSGFLSFNLIVAVLVKIRISKLFVDLGYILKS